MNHSASDRRHASHLRLTALFIALLAALLACPGASLAGTLLNDPFTDGSRSNTNGGDASGGVWYASTTGTLTITNDNGGLGSSNALRLSPSGSYQKMLVQFHPVTMENPGDWIQMQFLFRFGTPPSSSGVWGALRAGIYNTLLSRTTADASSSSRSDDCGYGGLISSPASSGTNVSVFAELAGDEILGGPAPYHVASFGVDGISTNCNTNRHWFTLLFSRNTNSDLVLSAQLDNLPPAVGFVNSTSVLTWTFDEAVIGEGSIALPLLVDNVVVTSNADDDYEKLVKKWHIYLTGGTNYNLADATVRSSITSITNTANSYWNSMDKSPGRTFLWSTYVSTNNSSELTSVANRLNAMAKAYACWGGSLYTNDALAADIISAFDWFYTNRYNETKSEYDNWWDWEIGVPMAIQDAYVMLRDRITPDQMDKYLRATKKFTPTPDMTGANLMWQARVTGVRAALQKDYLQLKATRDCFSSLFPYVTSGDGFYTDGSFIQHTKHPYTGGYGASLLNTVAPLLSWLQNTSGEISDPAQTNIISWVYNSYAPLIYRGAMGDHVRGREVSRTSSDHSTGRNIMESIFRISRFTPPDHALRMKSLLKYWISMDSTYAWTNHGGLTLLTEFRQMLADTNIPPAPEPVFNKVFAGMDRVMHCRPGFGFAISASSSRIYNYESINKENLHGWFTGSGMTYLNNGDLTQFTDSFWPTVDPYRLPGTTVDTMPLADSAGQSWASTAKWIGGASLENKYGVAGMDLDAYSSSLAARKSWFMFDNEIVCLGAGITCGGSSNIETTIENRRLSSAGSNPFWVNGNLMPSTLGWSSNMTGISWCCLSNAGGYYFPGGATLGLLRQARTGALSDINSGYSTNPITRNYLTLSCNHGIKPTNATYAYVLLPNLLTNEVSAYAARPDILILENSSQAQAVRETNLNLLAVNFWNTGSKTVDFITSSGPSSIITRETPNGLWIAASDPTQTNTGTLTLTLNRSALAPVAADSGVTINRLTPAIQLSISLNGRRGQTASALFAFTTNTPPVVSIISPPDDTITTNGSVSVTVDATAPDPGRTISLVELYCDGIKLAESVSAPYQFAISNLDPGIHLFTARATDSAGRWSICSPLNVRSVLYAPTTLIDAGSIWRYRDEATDPGTAWRYNNYNDSTWKSGPAMLGFGDANGVLPSTIIASNKQWTAYFRRSFYVADTAWVQSLNARLQRDDGAVIYLNGNEIWRDNMPQGTIVYSTPASNAISGTSETNWLLKTLSSSLLSNGWNCIAAEVHQNTNTSSDIVFDFKLACTAAITANPAFALRPLDNIHALSWSAQAGNFALFTTTNITPPALWLRSMASPALSNDSWIFPLPTGTNKGLFYRLQTD